MALIKSISGIRGTIGGKPGEGLSPLDAVKFTAAFATWVKLRHSEIRPKLVLGRDARMSGDMFTRIVTGTLQGMGIDVIDLGLSTTPTVEMAVVMENAQAGIILTASHNPKQWNALKLLNEKGEFISGNDGELVLSIADREDFNFVDVNQLGKVSSNDSYFQKHIDAILALPLVNVDAIRNANFSIVVDAVNSTGGLAIPMLLKALGVENVTELYCTPDGNFPHNPEPLPEHLRDLSAEVVKSKAHIGISIDPDVDRLALVCEDGEMFGEEYTLVAVADYILKHTPGATVSNLSSTKALRDITEKSGNKYFASAVGEVNVVEMMKANNAIIGGEGNGGIIYPELHYGRDALVGIALFLSHLAAYGKTISMLRASYPSYFISQNKVELTPELNVDEVLVRITKKYERQPVNTIDGVKIEFENSWVHLRKSNTEPIIRIYAEAENMSTADSLASKIISDIKELSSEMMIKH